MEKNSEVKLFCGKIKSAKLFQLHKRFDLFMITHITRGNNAMILL